MVHSGVCARAVCRTLSGVPPARPRLVSSAPRVRASAGAVHRSLSLWTAQPSDLSSSLPTQPSSSLPPSLPPGKPSLVDLSAPTVLPDPTFLEPLSAAFLSLAPSLSLSYAALIPLFTLLYRSTTTLPIVLWQRRRTRRFVDVVLPLLRQEQARLALETRTECRRAGKSYEEYQQAFKVKAKKAAYALARKYRCSPRLTLILPPVTHIPIFITATLVLRDACARATEALALAPASLSALLESSPASTLTASALAHLHDLAATPFLWCPSLVLPDPTLSLPLGVGLAALLNVEVTAKTRRAATAAAAAVDRPDDDAGASAASPSTAPGVSASERRRQLAQRARAGSAPTPRVRGLATTPALWTPTPSPHPSSSPALPAASAGSAGANLLPRPTSNERRVTNILRAASIAFIPLAAMAPSAVCVYWVTSNLFTLVQNLAFWWADRGRERERRMRDILSGRAVGV